MDAITLISLIVSFVSIVGGTVSIIIAIRSSRRTDRQDAASEASELQAIQRDTSYTKDAVDELRLDIREQRRETNHLADKVARVEERCKNTQAQVEHLQLRLEQHVADGRTE